MFRPREGFAPPLRWFAFGDGPLRLHWSCAVDLFYLSFVWRLALVLVCVLRGGGFVCCVGGCVLRLVLVLVARVALAVVIRALSWFWSRVVVSF